MTTNGEARNRQDESYDIIEEEPCVTCTTISARAGHFHGEDEFVLDTPIVRRFISAVQGRIDAAPSSRDACASIEPMFVELLTRRDWLPAQYQEDAPEGGMGGGIGQWLLYRSGDRSLCLFSLVVPPGSKTPIHDHLAWGLIGLYRGSQDEEFYRPGD